MKDLLVHAKYCLTIRWPDVASADYFEHGAFDPDLGTQGSHRVDHDSRARFVVTRKGHTVTLDYGAPPVKAFNRKSGMNLGQLRLTLGQSPRRVRQVEWRTLSSKAFEVLPTGWAWFVPPPPSKYVYSQRKGKKVPVARAVRDAQAALKTNLLRAYGGKCCVTGCAVPSALDAAHLDPAGYVSREHVCNAVLLRADLHRLFDANQLGIRPGDGKVHLRGRATTDHAFASLEGRRARLPCGTWSKYRPDAGALERKWKRFSEQ
jgi:hypothetical protein